MRFGIFVVVLALTLASFGNVIAIESTIGTDFSVEGCTYAGGSENLAKDSCSGDGQYYCDGSSGLHNTISEVGACNLGASVCCPGGYECVDSGSGLKCELRVLDCVIAGNSDCGINSPYQSCFWVGDPVDGICTDRPLDFSCSAYGTNSTQCADDVWNLGQEGFGTSVCNGYFLDGGEGYVSPQYNCACVFDGGKCKLEYFVQEDIYEDGAPAIDTFSCLKDFTSGPCTDGKQAIDWTAVATIEDGFGGGIPGGLLTSSECEDSAILGSVTRTCGQPVISLPGFGLVPFVLSSLLIGLFYAFRREDFE